jgi:hypothetical protein
MVRGWTGVVGATLEPSGFSPSVSQRELCELEGGFPKVKLHVSYKMRQIIRVLGACSCSISGRTLLISRIYYAYMISQQWLLQKL